MRRQMCTRSPSLDTVGVDAPVTVLLLVVRFATSLRCGHVCIPSAFTLSTACAVLGHDKRYNAPAELRVLRSGQRHAWEFAIVMHAVACRLATHPAPLNLHHAELLHRYMMISATDGSVEECQAYARRAARGFRPPIDSKFPTPVRDFLNACWAHNPADRPSMEGVVKMLHAVREQYRQYRLCSSAVHAIHGWMSLLECRRDLSLHTV